MPSATSPVLPRTPPNPVAHIEGAPDDELQDVQVPVPMKDRVFNKTGIQCVWCSHELLGRYAEEPKLIGLTDHADCKGTAGPADVDRKLTQIKVKYAQVKFDKPKAREFIRKAVVEERRGITFSVPGHVMNLVHYDEKKKVVKYINNSDRQLLIRTWSMDEFERHWEGWVSTIYADKDIIPNKYAPTHALEIIHRGGRNDAFGPNYILRPSKK